MVSGGRRTHRKSRTGCSQCKARKVKCDETRPGCKNCQRHGVSCAYPTAVPGTGESTGTGSPGPGLNSSQTPNRMFELELLHHFTTCTCYTISRHPVMQTIWRVNVPQLGFTSHFLMNAVFALSALHLSNFKPGQKEFYVSQGIQLYNVALAEVARILPNVTQENCAALYIFAILTSVISCAKPREAGNLLAIGDDGISEWLLTFRGVRSIVDSASHLILSGPVASIFSEGKRKIQAREAVVAKRHEHLLNVYRLVDESTSDAAEQNIYTSALDEMSKSFTAIFQTGAQGFESSDVFFWLFLVSDDYLRLLADRKPTAVIIFAHFCVLLKQIEWTWWMHGWSTHLVADIYYSLDDALLPWLQWPMEQIGWVPAAM